ncbi:MAG: crotonase/enoyl-CoA hydratase family protein [Gammaproteobacteria bacterium]|nr:crotonase/enoyl-CoA hydratase family protein [Gammaproteobacteria bacterium]MBU0850501.1 crotonase/enoyl-CoA hydratase family protein [Gammaproteobacteria bacterium]MBU1267115.1 crotonase/enoyl-CoA hydratase family protein [Gammaproteobacteria bacterium]MBU1529500.1 crotonase/enoyl-CoA hydratase family protein [Gammaproteobacteria bacterium]MBU1780513.1 crotonase/enoyl-CoA hydratase family protein [Gammaproteobacteria bacterium]
MMDNATEEPVNTGILQQGEIWKISINRPQARNCVDRYTADQLEKAFLAFETDATARVAILTGEGGNFCAGADLKAVASGDPSRVNRMERHGAGPMGISRMELSKPVIAAVSGYCVAGGLELAAWCDMRVADSTAVFGVFCRRFGVPLIDGGTVRLPRLIGQSRAMDMILTGRAVNADEAFSWGLANRIETHRSALEGAIDLAKLLSKHPQTCMRNDRQSVLTQWEFGEREALEEEFEFGLNTLSSGETVEGATAFKEGVGRHGEMV